MRAAVRCLALIILVACSGTEARAQALPVPRNGGVNALAFQAGSPSPKLGGVDVAVTQSPTADYTCTKLTIRVIDNVTGLTLATHTVDNPPGNVSQSFTNLGNNREIQVAVTATFVKGETVDTKRIDSVVRTQ